MKRSYFFCLLCFFSFLGEAKLFSSIKALYRSIDPKSVTQNFAFYELYPHTEEGKKALQRGWVLLNKSSEDKEEKPIFPSSDIHSLIHLVNHQSLDTSKVLSEEQRSCITQLARGLSNRKLKGSSIWKEEELATLAPEEIDICRGLFLAELGEKGKETILYYEACIDLMALQILAHLPEKASSLDKIREINRFIFHEMRFRFPPHSLWAKDIDVYTFLPSVIDSRKGVCLGVSILYLCLAQRLDLSLEAVTPPGHIYLRYRKENGDLLNIETTARGIDIPSEAYLGVETKKLQTRNPKEIIGLAFINQASVAWSKEDFSVAVTLYEKALPFLSDDILLKEFLGYNYLFVGKTKQGKELLEKVRGKTPDFALRPDTIVEDYLDKKTDEEGIKAVFSSVDETRDSILEKQSRLEKTVKKHPRFRAGLLQLAGTWLQLGREKEALTILKRYEKIDPFDPTVNYYLSAICYERFDFNNAWKYLLKAEKLVFSHSHRPKALINLRKELTRACPEPRKKFS